MTCTLDGHHRPGALRAGVEQLLDRLNEPRTLEALNRLLDHAKLLACSAVSLDGLVRQRLTRQYWRTHSANRL